MEQSSFTTINPYRFALREMLERMKWDLKKESWRSRHHLKLLRNKFEKQKAVILCNGPSLLKSEFSILRVLIHLD